MSAKTTTPPLHHSKSTTLLLFLLLTVAATIITAPPAHAQTSPGTIFVSDPVSCPTNFYSGMTCFGATITCPNTDNLNVTFGYVTQAATPTGTIVFFTGGGGTASTIGPTNSFADDYVAQYMIVYVEWASDWEKATASGTENILYAACRPATLLYWINASAGAHPSGAMCAQGKSAGSAAIAYSMSWYQADSFLTNVELLAGPVLSEINLGCKASPPSVTICGGGSGQPSCQSSYPTGWSTSAGYTSNDASGVNGWAGITDCGSSSGTELTTLADMSIVGGQLSGVTPKYSFNTKRHAWVCAGPNTNYYMGATDCPGFSSDCPNNSSPQGWYWYAEPSTADINLAVSGTNTCKGTGTGQGLYDTEAEGVEGGFDPILTTTSETNEIEADMRNNCALP